MSVQYNCCLKQFRFVWFKTWFIYQNCFIYKIFNFEYVSRFSGRSNFRQSSDGSSVYARDYVCNDIALWRQFPTARTFSICILWWEISDIKIWIFRHDTRCLPGERRIARLWRSGSGSSGGGSPDQLRDRYHWSSRFFRIGTTIHRDGEMERSPGDFLRQHGPHDNRYPDLITP